MILASHGIIASSGGGVPLLLDTYSGALGAYSLRKIKSTYTGYAIRVRRSSDNTSQDIGFVNNVLDTSSIASFVGANNGHVSIWYDQSGNGNNFLQSTLVNQPLITESGVLNVLNTKPTINLGSSSRFLELPSGFLNITSALSYFQVSRIFDANNGGVFSPSTTNSTGLEILLTNVISRKSLLRINSSIRNDNSGAAYQLWNSDVQTHFSIHGNSTSTNAYKNNSLVTLTDSSAMPSLNFNGVYAFGRYANTNYMPGDVQELIIYNNDKSANQSQISTNINDYYSIY